jgi:hypothetical protein
VRQDSSTNQITSAIVIGITVITVWVAISIAEGEPGPIPSIAMLMTLAAAPASLTPALICKGPATGIRHYATGSDVPGRTCSHSGPAAIECSGSGTTAATEGMTSAAAHGHSATVAAATAAAMTFG